MNTSIQKARAQLGNMFYSILATIANFIRVLARQFSIEAFKNINFRENLSNHSRPQNKPQTFFYTFSLNIKFNELFKSSNTLSD